MLDMQVSPPWFVAPLTSRMLQMSNNICLFCSRDQRANLSGASPRLPPKCMRTWQSRQMVAVCHLRTGIDPSLESTPVPEELRTDKATEAAGGAFTWQLLQLQICESQCFRMRSTSSAAMGTLTSAAD
jgi:hypothetical protein